MMLMYLERRGVVDVEVEVSRVPTLLKCNTAAATAVLPVYLHGSG